MLKKKKMNNSFQRLVVKSIKKFKKKILFNDQSKLKNIHYEELEKVIYNVSIFLKKNKILPRQKVLIAADNSNETTLIIISLLVLNRVIIPVNPEITSNEIKYIIKDSKPNFILTKSIYLKFIRRKKIIENLNLFQNIPRNEKTYYPKIRDKDIAEIVYTSGSTGDPKGVVLTHDNIVSQIYSINNHFKFSTNDRFLTMTPLFHNSGQFFSTFVAILNGSSNLIVNPKLAFINFWHIVSSFKITWTLGMGSHINYLVNSRKKYKTELKGIVIGGMRLEAKTQEQFEKKFKVKILKTYGLTETCSFATCDKPSNKKIIYGSSGSPINVNKIKIFDEKNNECKTNIMGEIRIRGKNIFLKYLNKKKLTKKKFYKDWFCTGDIGYFDKKNNIFIEDRIDNMIIVSGENIYPSEIERLIMYLKEIDEGYVIGLEDKIKGKKLSLFFKSKKKISEKIKIKWKNILTKYIPNYKIPQMFINIKDVGLKDFPRLHNGKINKLVLSKFKYYG